MEQQLSPGGLPTSAQQQQQQQRQQQAMLQGTPGMGAPPPGPGINGMVVQQAAAAAYSAGQHPGLESVSAPRNTTSPIPPPIPKAGAPVHWPGIEGGQAGAPEGLQNTGYAGGHGAGGTGV
ncbi:unnamed protein product, partial [Ectocarpus sp. 12 AP-2014]